MVYLCHSLSVVRRALRVGYPHPLNNTYLSKESCYLYNEGDTSYVTRNYLVTLFVLK
jgi:hypothetical protein